MLTQERTSINKAIEKNAILRGRGLKATLVRTGWADVESSQASGRVYLTLSQTPRITNFMITPKQGAK